MTVKPRDYPGRKSEDIKKALMELTNKYRQARPASQGADVGTDDLTSAEIPRQVKPEKGDYFRIAKFTQEYGRLPLLSMLVLWTRYGAGKLGIMRFVAVSKDEPVPKHVDYTEWESKVIAAYVHRHKL